MAERVFKVFDSECQHVSVSIDIFPSGESFITIENEEPDSGEGMSVKLSKEDIQWLIDNVSHELGKRG